MKKSKILNFLRGGSGGSKAGEDPIPPSTLTRHSTKRYNREAPLIPTLPVGVPGVERSSSWKYTQEQAHTPDSYSINSSPSILDGRTLVSQVDDPNTVCIEKSQSWSGDRMLESATDSGSSRGGTNASSRAGSGSRAGSRTGTIGSSISRDRLGGTSRSGSRGGSRTGSRVGSDHGDSTPSSVYDQDLQYTSYTDADGYENVELPSPQRQVEAKTEPQEFSRIQGTRLSVKGSTRRSRRPSPRRSQKKQTSATSSPDEGGLRPGRGSVKGSVPSISLIASSPVPSKSHRSPSSESNQSAGGSRHNLSRSSSRPQSRSPSHQPNRPTSRASSKQSSRTSSRSPNRSSSQEQFASRPIPPSVGGPRSMSYEETVTNPLKQGLPGVPPLWKARSWQQYGQDGITPQIERARQLARSRWEEQQQQLKRMGQSTDIGAPNCRQKSQPITRQEAVYPHVIAKSRSWQQSHESDMPPEGLTRTYTTHERHQRRTGSVRLVPPSQETALSSLGPSPARSPVIPLVPHPSPANQSLPQQRAQLYQWQQSPQWQQQSQQQQHHIQQQIRRQHSQQLLQQQQQPIWEPLQPHHWQHLSKQQQQMIHRQMMFNPSIRFQTHRSFGYSEGSGQSTGQSTPHNPSEYVELRDYEAMERQRYGQEKHQRVGRTESFKLKQPRPESYQGSHDQFIRSQFPQQVPLPQSQFPDPMKPPQKGVSTVSAKYMTPPNDDEYASLQDIVNNDPRFRGPQVRYTKDLTSRSRPVKSSSLMTSQELLHTLKRQLALSSPAYGARSKSLEAGRAAASMYGQGPQIVPQTLPQNDISPGTLTPALQALVAEKRARLKRSTVAFTGSITAGLTSDSECEDKKSSTSSVAGGDGPPQGGGGGGKTISTSSPQPQSNLVSSHDYNMEQSNVKLLKAELKIVSKDRDVMKKELKKVTRDRDDALKRLDQTATYGTLTKHGTISTVNDKNVSVARELETLKLQYEKAIIDIQSLRKQNLEYSRKYDSTLKDVEYYRKQERTAYTSMQNLRLQYEEVVAEKQKLENEVTSLQTIMDDDRKEIAELRRQQQEAMTQEGSGEAINQLYITTLRKYEALKDEYDSVRKRYSELAASHSNNISKLELAQEEVSRLKKQYEEVVREKNCLKQQCTEAIRQWDTSLRDKNKIQEEILKMREKNEELGKEMNGHMIQNQNLSKELKRLQSERNAAMQEYTLVMSERDTVHKEMDKLQEELNIASKKIKSIEQNTKDNSNERDSMQLQLETLKREIAASLHDRDKAIKECNELRERFGAKDDSNKEWEQSYKDYDSYKQERDMKMKESADMVSSSHEMYSKAQKERLENLDQANQEIDRLRKTVEKLQSDLEEAKREAEVSKRRRDWAFSERDKIVQERESIRAHCDKLRHERDRAVSDLADALRDSDDMMKQRNEASKKLKELKEKLEAEQEKSAAMRHMVNHNNSRDSAIDTDMQEWEIETLQMQTGFITDRDFGFEISGGADDPHYGSNDGAVFVSSVSKDGPFDGKLRLHDQLIRINGLECQSANRNAIYSAVLNGGGWVQITVRRRRNGGRTHHTTHLHCPHPAHHGLTLQTGVYIANILPGTPAAREGNLAMGDRVLNVNGKPLENASREEAQSLLDSVGEIIQLTTLKSVGSSSFSAPLSSSSSGHNMTEDDKSISSSRPYSSPTSPSKENYSTNPARVGSRELALKINRGGAQISDESVRRLGSSERVVYNVTKATEEKGSGGPWGQFKNIVKPRRHSKERGEGRSESREKDDKKKHHMISDPERDNALAQLDSVIDTYHYKTSSNGSSNTGTTKRSKKKDKEKSGGTWPKSRGGLLTFSDIGNGTIKTSQWRKERPPLSMYLPLSGANSDYKNEMKVYDSCQSKPNISSRMSGTSSSRGSLVNPRSQVFSIYKSNDSSEYKLNEHYSNPHVSTSMYSSNLYQTQPGYSIPRSGSSDHKSDDVEKEKDHHSSPDTSIDFSVRSGNVGKEELEYYVKKNRVKYPLSDSESNLLPLDTSSHQPSSLPPVYLSRPSPLHPIGERIPSSSRIPHSHVGLYSPPSAALRVPPAFTPYSPLSFQLQHPHSHPHTLVGAMTSYSSPHYSTPPLLNRGSPHFLTPSRSGDSILSSPGPDRDPTDIRGCYEHQISSSPTSSFGGGILLNSGGGFYHSASPSIDSGGGLHKNRNMHTHAVRASSDEPPSLIHHSGGPPSYHDYQRSIATIPRKKDDQRIRIPSNSSVPSKNNGIRNGFMERGFDRNLERESPMPVSFSVTQIHHSVHNQRFSSFPPQRKPQPGDIRNIYIEKESEPLGIRIKCLESGGVYVSSVTLNSLAAQVGLCIGDQLLEVCGINMRSATKEVASTVLSQCGSSVTMLVQFNPEKYNEAEGWDESSSGGSIAMGSRSGTPTPQNSPKATRSSPLGAENDDEDLPPSSSSTLRAPLDTREALELVLEHSLPPSARSSLTRPQTAHILQVLKRQDTFSRRSNNSDNSNSSSECQKNKCSNTDPRLVYLEMSKCHNLGIQMVGGNAVGIFIHSVLPDSPAAKADLRIGDRILKYNNVNLEHATAEQAAFELAKPADKVTMLIQWDFQTYSKVKDQPGDSFYVRSLFDKVEQSDTTELRVHKDDILYVDNTMFNNMPGQWRAWLVDEDGHKRECGTIPSKDKVEEEMMSQRNMGDLPIDSTRRGSTSARRSFFKRKKHSRSSSRDSKELASFSDASLNSYTEAAPLPDELMPLSYLRVERLDYLVRRPVVMVGPLWELVCDKLVQDFPHKFTRCTPEIKHCSQTEIEMGIQNHTIVDYRRRGTHYEATTVAQVKEICDKSCHGILDVSLGSVDRLHRHNIYPIVLMLKFKHHRHIREISDAHLSSHERLSQKEAKEMYDITSKFEQEYKHLVSAVITAGVNMAYICTQVKTLVDREQSKTLWVPVGPL